LILARAACRSLISVGRISGFATVRRRALRRSDHGLRPDGSASFEPTRKGVSGEEMPTEPIRAEAVDNGCGCRQRLWLHAAAAAADSRSGS
jgi:hypothetical protein